jgi:hypothetical protein
MNPLVVDIGSLSAAAQRILDPNSPAPMRAMAAKGVIPGLKPADIVAVVVVLAHDADALVSSTAQQTLSSLPRPILDGALDTDLPAAVIDSLASAYRTNEQVIGRLLLMSAINADTVTRLAKTASEAICERIATNEQRLLKNPEIIEALYMNRATRMSTADRVLELAVRNGLELGIPAFREASQAVQNELISEPSEEPTPDDLAFSKMDEIAKSVSVDPTREDTFEVDEEGNEKVADKCVPIWVQLGTMTISQKIRRAMLGSGAERLLLVRDTNRLVASAAIRSPLMQDPEVERISGSRSVDSEVLRIIANDKKWSHNYQIKLNLVMNPRTPFSFAAKLIPLLRESELKTIAKSKNVTSAIQTAAKQHLSKRTEKNR